MRKWFAFLAVLGLLLGCAAIEEAEEEETTLAPGPENAQQGRFDPSQMQQSIMRSRQRTRSMGR